MIGEYLQRYNYTEERFLAWLKSQGLNPQDAINLIITYSKGGVDYRSGNELCSQLVKDLNKIDIDRIAYAALAMERERTEAAKEEPVPVLEEKSRWAKIWDLILGR